MDIGIEFTLSVFLLVSSKKYLKKSKGLKHGIINQNCLTECGMMDLIRTSQHITTQFWRLFLQQFCPESSSHFRLIISEQITVNIGGSMVIQLLLLS